MSFTGSCHCGAVAYTVDEATPAKALECNCSICRRKAPLHHFTTPDKFTLNTSRDALITYSWNKHAIRYQFCKTCGAAPFAEGDSPNGPMIEINLRCVDDIDLESIEIEKFDGAHLVPGPQ